ncbi:protein max-like isoform X2 [Lineus longissimus]|uniref:protein max-like isoform X2 n=1 Tax=Lineus longissimus TaxID=88925 RepID=UPI00315DBBC8
MSDEDRDVDIESDIDDDDQISIDGMGSGSGSGSGINIPDGTQFMTQAEKRAHHNALERKRRDHIKESFSSLRDSVPALHGEKVSRAQILKKASDYIQYMRKKNHSHQSDIDDLKKQNYLLDSQVRALEKAKSTGQFANQASTAGNPTPAVNPKGGAVSAFDGGSDSESSESIDASKSKRKKLKTTPK